MPNKHDFQVGLAKKSDAEDMLAILKELDEEPYSLYFETDREINIDRQREIISDICDDNKRILLIARKKGIGIGFCGGTILSPHSREHIVNFAIGVRRRFRRKGVGYSLLTKLCEWARSNNVIKLEASVIVENRNAVQFYKNFGFTCEGLRKCAVQLNSTNLDEYYIARML